jgi:predicted TIM-barrel fold metal-dependent hydrolase
MKKGFDAHCHLFDVQYVFKEALAMSNASIIAAYQHARIGKGGLTRRRAAERSVPEIVHALRTILKTALFTDPSTMLHDLESAVTSKLGVDSFAAVPLMMDIFYMFDPGTPSPPPDESLQAASTALLPAGDRSDLMDRLAGKAEMLKQEFIKLLTPRADPGERAPVGDEPKNGPRAPADVKGLAKRFDSIIGDLQERFFNRFKVNTALEPAPELSQGFSEHMAELEEIKRQQGSSVFPFLAVDPRRPGILELVRQKVGPRKSFAGVKLYPSLGYLPTHPKLFPIYDYCVKNDAPITVHASRGVIKTWSKTITTLLPNGKPATVTFNDTDFTPFDFFGAPDNWKPILKRYKGRLRVNFAHFGGPEELAKYGDANARETSWTKQIIDLMCEFPKNVYTDMSCTISPEILESIAEILDTNEIVRKRMIFGTDYTIELMFLPLDRYCEQVKAALDRHLDAMMFENPSRFLGAHAP